MEEKERYIIDRFDDDIFDTKKEYYPSNQTICEIINQQSKRIKELEEKLSSVYDKTNESLRFARDSLQKLNKENQQLKQQLAITEKALELACEHIKEDLKCDDTENEIYNYFKTKAKEMLENE